MTDGIGIVGAGADVVVGADRLSAVKRALLAKRLQGRPAAAAQAIPRRAHDAGPAPLSSGQERLWFLEQFAPGTSAQTIPVALRLRGRLDVEALSRAIDLVVERHETLRTRYPVDADGVPAVVVDPPAPVPLSRYPLPDAPEPDREHHVRALLGADAARSFDLATGPVLRASLAELAPDDSVLLLAVHHIACDGWSISVLVRELLACYDAAAACRPAQLPDLPVSYTDYASWQREQLSGPTAAADVEYWRQRLADIEPLELPTDRPRPPTRSFAGASHGLRLDRTLTDALTDLARREGATPFMALLAGFTALLTRYSGQHRYAVGTPVAGRSRPELEGQVGMFVNVLALPADLTGRPSFRSLLRRTRDTVLDGLAHQELPFEQLVQELDVAREVDRSAVFQVMFAMQNYASGADPGRAAAPDVEGFPIESGGARVDLELSLFDAPDGLVGALTYDIALFAEATVASMACHLEALLRAAVATPDVAFDELPLLRDDERDSVVSAWNATAAALPGTTLHGLVLEQAARTPDAPAVSYEGTTLTYAELVRRASAVARRLRAEGVGPGDLVAVCAERSPELLPGLLGVLLTGAGYVPLDPGYPADRLTFVLADAGTGVLLTQRELLSAIPSEAATTLLLEDIDVRDIDVGELDSRDGDGTVEQHGSAPDVAYAIWTSGSTGWPKGVSNTHAGITNRLDWMQRRFAISTGDTVLQKTPTGFDVSVWELFWPLVTGARLVLARPDGHRDAAYMRDLIIAEQITTVHFVPSMLAVFLAEDGVEGCTSLRRVVCSGEELPVDVARQCLATLPAELHNLYGPTEAAVDVSAWHCTPEGLAGLARVPIGAPVQNTRLYVLDPLGNPTPVGVPGELHIGGVQVALGYLGRPRLTADRFTPDPYGPPGSRLYRTGDLARWRPDGTVDFLGRLDGQVKLRGLRIELGEIETALREQPGVHEAAAVVREDVPGDKRIVAYLVGPAAAGDLRAALRGRLPDYMVPSAFVALDALPLSPNGKLDRRALPAPLRERAASAAYRAPASPTEVAVAAVWQEVLGCNRVSLDDDFFDDLGGHSLLATQLVARLRTAFGAGVSVMDVFQHRTLQELAAHVGTPADERGPRALLHELRRGAGAGAPTIVCVPYGGGSAVVYQPLADALPDGHRLLAVAIPGHDVGLDEQALPLHELAERIAEEVLEAVPVGPLTLYGHCAIGSVLGVEVARRVEAAGRALDAVYIGANFPFARPEGRVFPALADLARMERLRSNRLYETWLTGLGIDMRQLDAEQAQQIVTNMRRESDTAEAYFTEMFRDGVAPLQAPVIAVSGSRDPATEFAEERYREWQLFSPTTALVVLDEAGHFFLKYRATELAGIVSTVHRSLARPAELSRSARGGAAATWWVEAVSHAEGADADRTVVAPTVRSFLAVAMGQLVSMTGSALTEFALPLWIYLQTGSVAQLGLLAALGLVPGLLVAPLAGAVVDRYDRRRVMLAGDIAAGGTQLALALLYLSGGLTVTHIYPLLACLSVALVVQRLAYGSAVPQLVPKRYLGHANGVVQLGNGVAQVMVPLLAVGVLATVGLGGILLIDVLSYTVAIGTLLLVRFPPAMAGKRKESLRAEIVHGWRHSWGSPGLRAVLLFFAVFNVFLAPLFLLLSPLVLGFADLAAVGWVSFAGGLGVLLAGVAMAAWGGPPHRRVRAMLLCTLGLAASAMLSGLRPDLVLVATGVFGLSFALTIVNALYFTVVQVKVPQRFHGRVLALNTMIAWSTLPLGWVVVAPLAADVLGPLLESDGPLTGALGPLLGTGPDRGIALVYLLCGLAMAALVALAFRVRTLAQFDDDVPDAEPDDLIGERALAQRKLQAAGPVAPPRPAQPHTPADTHEGAV